MQSLRFGAMGMLAMEFVAIAFFLRCAASLPGDFRRDRSGDAGAPDAVPDAA